MSEQVVVLVTLLFALFIIILGAWGVFAPRSIILFIESWSSQGGLWLAILLRLAFAGVLWVAAPLSRTPVAFQVIAVLVGLTAVSLPLFGYTRFERFVTWWSTLPATFLRGWCLVAVVLGGFMLWSAARPIVITVPESYIEIRSAEEG